MKHLEKFKSAKFQYQPLIMITLGFMIVLSSCGVKDDIIPETTTPTTTPPPSAPAPPLPSDASGSLAAVKSKTTQTLPEPNGGTIEIDYGIAVAAFFNDPTANEFISAGDVTCEGEALKMQSSNQYAHEAEASQTEGLPFDGNVDWVVTGANGIPAFTHSVSTGFPTVKAITSGSTIKKTTEYTLSVPTVSGADSIIFMIGSLMHVTAGNVNSYTFPTSELANIDAGNNIVQVVGYNLSSKEFDGKKIYFINETAVNQTVTVE